jgi:MoxR-like ATPase
LSNIREKVLLAINETRKNLYEREELAGLIWKTIGADLNLLMLGDPGTAKTMLALNLTKVIKDAKIFHYTLNSFTTIDEIFGHFDLLELKNNNKLKRNTNNKLLDCHIAYLDEFFKCNSGTLNALLDVMNEKSFTDSYGTIKLPLKFLISSSNELPSEEDNLAAVLDRFQVKYLVKSIQDHSVRINAYLQSGTALETIEAIMTPEDIDEFRNTVATVEYTQEVAEMTEKIYQAIVKQSIYVSDRTVFRTIPLVKAQAFLSGRNQVEPADLLVLKDAFWNEMSEIKDVKKVIFDLADPISGKIEEIWEAIQETIDEKTKEIKTKEKNDPAASASISFELIKKINHAKDQISKHVKTMKQMKTDYSDAEIKVKRLEEKVSELFDQGSFA